MGKKVTDGHYLRRITAVSLLTALFAVSSYIQLPMAIPVTLQTFVLSMCLYLFGTSLTVKMLAVYTLAGCIGIPVFSSFRAGISVLLEPTGGYILGFFLMTLCYGVLQKVLPCFRMKNQITALVSLVPLYVCGSVWYALVYLKGNYAGVWAVVWVCVLPYIVPDAVKVLLGSLCAVKLKKHSMVIR